MSVTHTITGGLVHLSGNPIQIFVTSSGPTGEHYKCALKITCDGLFGSPFPPEEIAPLAGVSEFDISGFVDQPVAYEFDYPAIEAAVAHNPLVFNVTVQCGETWIDEDGNRVESWQISSVLRIVKGSLRAYELALLNEAGKSFASEYIDGGKFLTHLANNQKVSEREELKLWYLSRWNENHAAILKLSIETDYLDNPIILSEEFVLTPNGLFEFTVNPYFFGFNIPPGLHVPAETKVLSFTFWLTDGSGDISERRRFVVDDSYHERTFTFYYVNPLSGIDMIWLTGEYTEGLKTESETAYRKMPVGAGTKVSSLTTISTNGQRSWQLNTGSKSREELLSMRDFLEAKERWMIDPDLDTYKKLIPVVIESGDYTLYQSLEQIQNLEIKVLEAHR